MALEIFNTLSGQKEEFVALRAGEVRMYVCGVIVYDLSHFRHCRFLLTLFSRQPSSEPNGLLFSGLEEAARSMDRIYETIDRVDRRWPGEDKAVADPASLDEFRKEMPRWFQYIESVGFDSR
jgi:hypothetical protein